MNWFCPTRHGVPHYGAVLHSLGERSGWGQCVLGSHPREGVNGDRLTLETSERCYGFACSTTSPFPSLHYCSGLVKHQCSGKTVLLVTATNTTRRETTGATVTHLLARIYSNHRIGSPFSCLWIVSLFSFCLLGNYSDKTILQES